MTATGARSPAAEPPPELVARFKAALERLWPEGGKLGLAVSGGPDSLAMMLLAEAAIPERTAARFRTSLPATMPTTKLKRC